jgi:hypothetical protein
MPKLVVKGGGVGEMAGEVELAGGAEDEGDEEGNSEEVVGAGELDIVGDEDGNGVMTDGVGEYAGEVEPVGDAEGDGKEEGDGSGVLDGEGDGVGDGVVAGGVVVGLGFEVVQVAVAVLAAFMVTGLLVMLVPDASPVQPLNVYCVPASFTDATDTWAYAVVPASYQPVPIATACVEATVKCHCSSQLKNMV